MLVSKIKAKREDLLDPVRGPLFSVRFLIAVLLVVPGIAWVVMWTTYVRDLYTFEHTLNAKSGKPDTWIPGAQKLKDWNWAIGFGLILLGLASSAHPKTPLGRGRGVVVGMLACFLIGLIWICTFYVFADKIGSDPNSIWLLGSLGQLNLMVGIGFMAVGFTFATRWE
jgi:hypothetical protein